MGSAIERQEYQDVMRARLSWLVGELKRLDAGNGIGRTPSQLLLLRVPVALLTLSRKAAAVPVGTRDRREDLR